MDAVHKARAAATDLLSEAQLDELNTESTAVVGELDALTMKHFAERESLTEKLNGIAWRRESDRLSREQIRQLREQRPNAFAPAE